MTTSEPWRWNEAIDLAVLCGSCDGKDAPDPACEACRGTGSTAEPLDFFASIVAMGRMADRQTQGVHGKPGACNEAYAECICWLEPGHDGPHTCSRGDVCLGQWTGTIGEQRAVRLPMGRVVPV